MQAFEKEYRGRFKAAEDRSGIDENQLWEAIAADLPPAGPKEVRKSRFWILLPFIFGLSLLFGDWPAQIAELAATEPVVQLTTGASSDQKPQRINIEQQSTAPLTSTSVPSIPPITHTATDISNITASTPYSSVPIIEIQVQENTVVTNGIAEPNNESLTTISELKVTATVLPLPGTSIPPLSFAERERPTPELLPSSIKDPSLLNATKKSLSWGIQAGVFQMEEQFSSHETATGYNQILGNAHAADGGYQLGVRAYFPIGQTFTLSTGLSYNAHYATFDWTTSRDTVIWRDNQPGGELVNAIADRRVRHQQALQWLSLPVSLGIESRHQRLSLGVQAGLGLNYMISQSGRSLDEDGQFITYGSDVEAPDPFNNCFLSSHLGLQLGYQLRDGLKLVLQPRLAYQVHGQSAAYNLKHSSTIFGINLGLVWK